MSHEPAENSMETITPKLPENGQPGSLRSDDLFGEFVRKHNLAVESLTEQQLSEVIRQAIASGDIVRNVTHDGSAQTITYIPYREVSRLRDQHHKLSHEVARLTRELDEAQRQINMDTVRIREMQDAGMKLEIELEQRQRELETCWNCGEERVCKETSLGPVCSHECAEQLFSSPDNVADQPTPTGTSMSAQNEIKPTASAETPDKDVSSGSGSVDPHMEGVSDKIRCGEPVGFIDALAAIEYQHQRKLQKRPALWKRVIRFFLPNTKDQTRDKPGEHLLL